MGLQDRLKQARAKRTDVGDIVTGYKGKTKDLGKYVKKQIKVAETRKGKKKQRKGKELIGSYKTKLGKLKEVGAPTSGQQRKMDRRGASWSSTNHRQFLLQATGLRGIGVILIIIGLPLFMTGLYFGIEIFIGSMFFFRTDLITYALSFLIPGIIFCGIGGATYSAGMARVKFMVLNPSEVLKSISEADIQIIADRFLSGA